MPDDVKLDALTELAERCEKATAEQQRELLLEAFETLTAAFVATPSAIKFVRMLDAEAYESAAMTLVPEGWTYDAYQGPSGQPHRWKLRTIGDGDKFYTEVEAKAATPALALCAAALRARGQSQWRLRMDCAVCGLPAKANSQFCCHEHLLQAAADQRAGMTPSPTTRAEELAKRLWEEAESRRLASPWALPSRFEGETREFYLREAAALRAKTIKE